jgi:C4-dicarboxylate-specific signal transduction histidine kinase
MSRNLSLNKIAPHLTSSSVQGVSRTNPIPEFSPESHQNIQLHFRDDNIIRVTSHGNQIPESFTQKMFYPFFSNKARGIGLGLSKCMYFAHELGYDIVLSENSSVKGISFDVKMS